MTRSPFGVRGKINGSLVFENGDERAFCGIFDSKDILKLRVFIENSLEPYGITTSSEHGFVPHVTLKYLDAGEAMPVNEILGSEIHVSKVCLIVGDNKEHYEL